MVGADRVTATPPSSRAAVHKLSPFSVPFSGGLAENAREGITWGREIDVGPGLLGALAVAAGVRGGWHRSCILIIGNQGVSLPSAQ